MDFEKFNSIKAGNEGSWMHVKSPLTGEPLFAGPDKPCRVRVLGIEGDIGEGVLAKLRSGVTSGDTSDQTDSEKLVEETAPLVVGYQNINRGEKPCSAPTDNAWFLGLQRVVGGDKPSFAQQISSFAVKRANVMGNASSGSLTPPSKSAG